MSKISNRGKKKKIIEGRWWSIENKIEKSINAKYHKIKDWAMDPKGYFLISLDREEKIIRVGYCTLAKIKNLATHDMTIEIKGNTAIEIVNTLIRENLISTLQHAADMGIELCKAELALKYNLKYIQDKDLNL
jgi:dihydropteroate synthase